MLVDQLSGDSDAAELRYEGGVASLRYTDGDTGRVFRLRVATDCLFSEAPAEAGSVHVRLVPLADVLPVDQRSGRYAAPPEFGPQMAAVREGLHLALGRPAAVFPFLLQVRGYRMVLACPVRAVHQVEVLPESGPS
ncbi:MAG TPA: hypothetical protein VM533_03785 [Fimbriiglobus sp.]|jgi:hypothetical protein|nr:hypothetical protein [Fimbriiglobus sp.]